MVIEGIPKTLKSSLRSQTFSLHQKSPELLLTTARRQHLKKKHEHEGMSEISNERLGCFTHHRRPQNHRRQDHRRGIRIFKIS